MSDYAVDVENNYLYAAESREDAHSLFVDKSS